MTDIVEMLRDNPVAIAIAVGEVAFWVMLFAGLAARYLLRLKRIGAAFLISVPLIDVAVLVATYLDMRAGATANGTHGLAALYLGFSVAFGHSWVRWADQRFAHRFAGGPPPDRPPKYGRAKVRYEWVSWGKCMIAWAIACGIILFFRIVFGEQAEPMLSWAGRMSTVATIWFAVGPLWTALSPPKDPDEGKPAANSADTKDSADTKEPIEDRQA